MLSRSPLNWTRCYTLFVVLIVTLLTLVACSAPEPTSTPIPPTPTTSAPEWPSARKYGAMVYDPTSKRIIMFGGAKKAYDSTDIRQVWAYELANSTWHKLGWLEPRFVLGAALDEESHRVILFTRPTTWAYDPVTDSWEQMRPDEKPSPRKASQIAYDAESDRIILFGGGQSSEDNYDDTWAYDYNTDTWTEMQPEVSPPGRGYHGMVYDPVSDRVLLWGGGTDAGVSDLHVWAYDYNTDAWTAKEPPANAPVYRAGFGWFYHSPSGRMMIFGGLSENYGALADQTVWAYDYRANSWEALTPSTSPSKRAYCPMAYAPSVNKALLLGGELVSQTADEISDETWVYDLAANEWENVMKP